MGALSEFRRLFLCFNHIPLQSPRMYGVLFKLYLSFYTYLDLDVNIIVDTCI